MGTEVPDDAAADLRRVGPEVTQRISSSRVATAWFADGAMAGAEACRDDLSWWDQYVAAVAHWSTPDGGVGWLSVRMPGPSTATASTGRLDVPSAGGDGATVVVGGVGDVPAPSGDRWALPGIDLELSTSLEPAGPGPFGGTAFTAPAGADVRVLLG